ncbi:MAG: hypothetical protein IPK78_00715 [Rhodospirillales bacterium]|nr:hypothetical protein [Rhodospirillales bacterium]
MPDPDDKRHVCLQVSLSPKEFEAVSRWASEAGCPDIESYFAQLLQETVAGRIRYEAWEKTIVTGRSISMTSFHFRMA